VTKPETVPAAELERMMKLQDVILKAMAKRITWMAAAEIAGVSDRTMRRMKERYEQFGYDGLFDQRRGKRSIHRIYGPNLGGHATYDLRRKDPHGTDGPTCVRRCP
jgi:hypothetical protein